ncbi:MAG: hypothetical protein GVY22_18205 [Gammaproteobacteria bacterium]|jgi:hypothetical protein|nr:hypothetical protein [Gammaproteobacteria bacterium]
MQNNFPFCTLHSQLRTMQQLLTGRVRLVAPGAAAGDDGVAIEAESAE